MASPTDSPTPLPVLSLPSVQPLPNDVLGGNRNVRGGLRGGRHNGRSQKSHRGGHWFGRGAYEGPRRGSGAKHHQGQLSQSALPAASSKPPPPGLGGGGGFGTRPTGDANDGEGDDEARGQDANDDDVDAEMCFICASPVVHNSVAPCSHRTCHICALRLRALYKTRACAHCRTEAEFVIFTDDPAKRYEAFVGTDFEQTDNVLGIKYEKKDIYDDTVLLLRYNCPEPDCDIACWGWPDLHRHVKSVHHKVMCDLCTRNKKVFTHEHELFTVQELRRHEKFGDDNPGAVDQSGFKGHPECGFCRERFYGDDELYTHCRDKHERCHICDRRNVGRHHQYYVDYNSLEEHFRKDHFLCIDRECLDRKFVVFESVMDLKAHQLEVHPNDLSKDARRDARIVDISGFDYRTPHQESRGNRREGRGRGRDPNTETIPVSSAQPLRRDELAYQRQMAIQSAQSVTTRTFGGQLTSNDATTPRFARHQDPVATATTPGRAGTNAPLPPIDGLSLDSTSQGPSNSSAVPVPQHTLTPQEQARRLQHGAVMDRASFMLKNDALKFSDFRTRVSSYRTSTISASQLIDSFFSLFDVSSNDLGKLVKELAEIYENEAKRSDLLKAWSDWRAVNEDYPSLPGPSGILPGSAASSAGSGGRRILKLKSSTAQSSRSAVSKQRSWGNAAAATALPPAPAASINRAGAGKVGPTPWVKAKPGPSPNPSRPSSTAPVLHNGTARTEAFPALPAAMKPDTTIFGLHRGSVRWDDRSSTPTNAWTTSTSVNASGNPSATVSENEAEEGVAGGKKKGNKGKKQTLYKFG